MHGENISEDNQESIIALFTYKTDNVQALLLLFDILFSFYFGVSQSIQILIQPEPDIVYK